MTDNLIDFEIVWLDDLDDTRPAAVGNLTSSRILDVTPIRRRDLSAACVAASNLFKTEKHPGHGFVVRRKR